MAILEKPEISDFVDIIDIAINDKKNYRIIFFRMLLSVCLSLFSIIVSILLPILFFLWLKA